LDTTALAKQASETNEPIAYVNVMATSSTTKQATNIDFDMTRSEAIELVHILDTIQKKLDESSY
jgi:hypothetical protein